MNRGIEDDRKHRRDLWITRISIPLILLGWFALLILLDVRGP